GGGGGASVTIIATQGTEVYNNTKAVAWDDLDLSGTIGAKSSLVILGVYASNPVTVAFRTNGNGDQYYRLLDGYSWGTQCVDLNGNAHCTVIVLTDSAGLIEWYAEVNNRAVIIDVLGYIN
ncbi:hypothetical protein LCGC14_1409120, partial [marine sediment metagenome]